MSESKIVFCLLAVKYCKIYRDIVLLCKHLFLSKTIAKILLILFVLHQVMIGHLFALSPQDIPNGVFYLDLQNTDGDDNPANEPTHGSNITELSDSFLSNSWSQITPGKQAIYNSWAINNHPSAFFDGVNDLFEIRDTLDIGSGTWYSEKSFSLVFKTSDDITTTQVIYEQWWKEKWFLFAIANSQLYAWVYNSIDWPTGEEYKIINAWTIQTQSVYILVFVYDSNNDFVKAYINRDLTSTLNNVSEQTTNGACPLDGTSFGCNLYASGGSIGLGAVKNDTINPNDNSEIEVFEGYHFKGHLWEIASWNTALTETQSLEMTDFLMEKWWFDDIAPQITTASPGSWSLLPWWNHIISLEYNDTHTWSTGVDASSIAMTLHKWDTVGAYGPDISGVSLSSIQTGTGLAEYATNNLDFWRYEYRFSVSDNAGNTQTQTWVFYIDQPEFSISSPEIDIWTLNNFWNTFSPTVQITVKTVGAWFDLTLNTQESLSYLTHIIPPYDGNNGFWHQTTPFSGNITTIWNDENIGTQAASININGLQNTYIFEIQLGAIVETEQIAWDYEWKVSFGIDLSY